MSMLRVNSKSRRAAGSRVLPGEFRSILAWVRLNELLVNPSATIVTAPYATVNEPTRNGSPWNNDRPQVPDTRPGWHCFRRGFCFARHVHISGSHSPWPAAITGLGAGPLRGGTKRPLIAQYSGATLAICATCSHARPLSLGRNETRRLTLMPASQVNPGTSNGSRRITASTGFG
jgi:hypothetical protein